MNEYMEKALAVLVVILLVGVLLPGIGAFVLSFTRLPFWDGVFLSYITELVVIGLFLIGLLINWAVNVLID